VNDLEYLRQKAPWLFNNNELNKDLYMENAAAGYYDNLPASNVPMLPAAEKSEWDFLDQRPDLDAYNRQVMAENQTATVQKEPSKWDKFSKGLLSVFPDILNAYVFSRDKTGSAIEAYNKEKQRQFDNQMTEKMYKQKMDEMMYERERQKVLDAKDDYRYEIGRNDKKDAERRAAEQWEKTYGLDTQKVQNSYDLALKKIDADTALAKGEIDFKTWQTLKEAEYKEKELKSKENLGWGEIGVKKAAIDAGLNSDGTPKRKAPTKKEIADSVYSDIFANLSAYRTKEDAIAAIRKQQGELLKYLTPDQYNKLLKAASDIASKTGVKYGSKFIPAEKRGSTEGFINYYLRKIKEEPDRK
jgi:hypothetical protein